MCRQENPQRSMALLLAKLATLIAVAVLLQACKSPQPDESQAESSPQSATEATEVTGEIVATPMGRWRLLPEEEIKVLQDEESAPGDSAANLAFSAESLEDGQEPESLLESTSTPNWRMAPVIETLEDLERFSGVKLKDRLGPILVGPEFQPVPGLPNIPRFEGKEFDLVRNAFKQECIDEAANYTNAFLRLVEENDLIEGLRSGDVIRASDEYEKNCLTPLLEVPLAVRNVIGVLGLSEIDGGDVLFCSATIVGPRRLLTSRHCFFHSDKGTPLSSWDAIKTRVTFYSAAPHGGTSKFSVRAIDPAIPAEKYEASDDHLVLRVLEGPFNHIAKIRTDPLSNLGFPAPAWIVGSNALLGDVRKAPSAFSYVRGSGPKACAVLGSTTSGCLYHSCQTAVTTSGAGVLVDGPDGFELVGVHKGAISEASKCEKDPPVTEDLNLAAEFTTADLSGV